MKAIITDFDFTLWGGIYGEQPKDSIMWGGMYEQYRTLLVKLAKEGVLIVGCTRNTYDNAKAALSSHEIDMHPDTLVNWVSVGAMAKSTAIKDIILNLNILPQDVVFIDDNKFELSQVKSAIPSINILRFPSNYETDFQFEFGAFVGQIRQWFPKHEPTPEDKLRVESTKQNLVFNQELEESDIEEFMSSLNGELVVEIVDLPTDRTIELINKTNQFNLNGKRFHELEPIFTILPFEDNGDLTVNFSYKDRFGDLGIIATVILTTTDFGRAKRIEAFCLSCRAMNRRIEYSILEWIHKYHTNTDLEFQFIDTGKNGPMKEFLDHLFTENSTSPNRYIKIIEGSSE